MRECSGWDAVAKRLGTHFVDEKGYRLIVLRTIKAVSVRHFNRLQKVAGEAASVVRGKARVAAGWRAWVLRGGW